MTTSYQIGSVYSFNVFPVTLFGNNFQNVTVQALLDAGSVQQLGTDIWGLHKQVYPTLPAGTPNDPTKFTYLKVKLQNGSSAVLAIPWIDDTTVVLVQTGSIQVLIGNVDASQMDRIKIALVQNGFTNLQFTILSSDGS